MATFSSWSAIRDDIKDKLATHVAGSPMVGEYAIGTRRMKYNNAKELFDLLKLTYEMEALESAGEPSVTVSYGRHRRFD